MRILRTFGRRTIPVGVVLAVTAAGVVGTAVPAFAAAAVLTLNTVGGPSGGSNVITATVGADTFDPTDSTAQHVQFQYRATGNVICAATYSGTDVPPAVDGSGVQTAGLIDVPTLSTTVNGVRSITFTVPSGLALVGVQVTALYNICIYGGTTGADVPIADTEGGIGYAIGPNRLNLNTYQGPSGGTNTITATTTGGTFTSAIGVAFQYAGPMYCPATYPSTVAPNGTVGTVLATSSTTLLTSTKAAVTVPAALAIAGGQTAANYNLCIYAGSGGSSALISGTALPYVIAQAVTISTVLPATGPAQGGGTLTVTGAAFPTTGISATLGGLPMTNLTVAGGGGSFTATIPAHAPGGPFNLVVTTQAGTATKVSVYRYTNGVTVTPSTAPDTSNSRTWVDVRGVGFADMDFTGTNGITPNGTGAHVYLVRGAYDPRPTTTGGSVKTNPQTLECVDVVVVDDTELICSLFLAGNQSSATVTRTVTGCTTTGANTALSAPSSSTTCTFTTSDVGMAISGGTIQAGTTVSALVGPTAVTLSRATTAALTSGTLTLTSTRTITDGAITQAGTSLTSTLTPFGAAEVGHVVSAPGVLPTGTVINSVNGSGVATVSNAAIATSAGATQTMTVFTPYPVTIGTYTVTVVNNGSAGAQAVAGYSQSIISSGSTFTVADYLRPPR
jgi:hypothetical protein